MTRKLELRDTSGLDDATAATIVAGMIMPDKAAPATATSPTLTFPVGFEPKTFRIPLPAMDLDGRQAKQLGRDLFEIRGSRGYSLNPGFAWVEFDLPLGEAPDAAEAVRDVCLGFGWKP